MLNMLHNADLNQKQKFTPPQIFKKIVTQPLSRIFTSLEYIKETNFEKVEPCVTKLCRSPISRLDPSLGYAFETLCFILLTK